MGSNGTSYNLLVVDDEPLGLKLIERTFAAEADMDVRVATSPVRGLEIAERQELDLVISDQRMPQMDGLAFLARVRDRRPRAHRILLTAYPEMEVALRAINEGLAQEHVGETQRPVRRAGPRRAARDDRAVVRRPRT